MLQEEKYTKYDFISVKQKKIFNLFIYEKLYIKLLKLARVGRSKFFFVWFVLFRQCYKNTCFNFHLKTKSRDFPGGQLGKTPRSKCRGPGFDPGSDPG